MFINMTYCIIKSNMDQNIPKNKMVEAYETVLRIRNIHPKLLTENDIEDYWNMIEFLKTKGIENDYPFPKKKNS